MLNYLLERIKWLTHPELVLALLSCRDSWYVCSKGRGQECLQRAALVSLGKKTSHWGRKNGQQTNFWSHLEMLASCFCKSQKSVHIKKVTLLGMLMGFLLKLNHKVGVWPAPPKEANVKGDLTHVKTLELFRYLNRNNNCNGMLPLSHGRQT